MSDAKQLPTPQNVYDAAWAAMMEYRKAARSQWGGVDRTEWISGNLIVLARCLRGSECDEPKHSVMEQIMQHAWDFLADDPDSKTLAAQLKREIEKLESRYHTDALRSLHGADEYPMHGSISDFEDNHTIGVLDSEELGELIELIEEAAQRILEMKSVQPPPPTTKGITT